MIIFFPEKNNTHNILSWSIKTSKLLAQKASIRAEPAHLWIWTKLAPTKKYNMNAHIIFFGKT